MCESIISQTLLSKRPDSSDCVSYISCLVDCDIVGKVNGVCFTFSKEGRPSGEAFIELKTAEDFKKALSKDRKYMGHRYIEGNDPQHFKVVLDEQRSGLTL